MLVLAERVAAPAEVQQRLRELLAPRGEAREDVGRCLVVSGAACRNGARESLGAALRRVFSSAPV
ncbi:MAG: hypothetical protein NT005_14165 [Spirochaetes bacterium]|nr:hypothetical protein [Spirochaetota bacterium]